MKQSETETTEPDAPSTDPIAEWRDFWRRARRNAPARCLASGYRRVETHVTTGS
jgi:hypothetical protein